MEEMCQKVSESGKKHKRMKVINKCLVILYIYLRSRTGTVPVRYLLAAERA